MSPSDPRHDGPVWMRLTYMMLSANYTGKDTSVPKAKVDAPAMAIKSREPIPPKAPKTTPKPEKEKNSQLVGPPRYLRRKSSSVRGRGPRGSIAVIVRYPDKTQASFSSIKLASITIGLTHGSVSKIIKDKGIYRSKQGHVIVRCQP